MTHFWCVALKWHSAALFPLMNWFLPSSAGHWEIPVNVDSWIGNRELSLWPLYHQTNALAISAITTHLNSIIFLIHNLEAALCCSLLTGELYLPSFLSRALSDLSKYGVAYQAGHQMEPFTTLHNYGKFESGAVFPCTTERRIKLQIETGLKASYQSSYTACLAR